MYFGLKVVPFLGTLGLMYTQFRYMDPQGLGLVFEFGGFRVSALSLGGLGL